MISFEKLFELLKIKGVSTYTLINEYNISPAQITRFKHNHNVSSKSICKMCAILKCAVEDICEYIPDNKNIKN